MQTSAGNKIITQYARDGSDGHDDEMWYVKK